MSETCVEETAQRIIHLTFTKSAMASYIIPDFLRCLDALFPVGVGFADSCQLRRRVEFIVACDNRGQRASSSAVHPNLSQQRIDRDRHITAVHSHWQVFRRTKDLTLTATWSCLLPAIATVSNSAPTQGVASAVTSGTVLVTASLGSVSTSAPLAVKSVTVTSMAVSPAASTIGFGTQEQFTATATFSDMSTQDVTNSAAWTSFPPFITSSSGLAIGKSIGVNTISATLQGVGPATPAMLTVDFSNLVSISVLPATPSIATHTRTQFQALGTFNDGSTRDISSQVIWASSDTAVANFSPIGSEITGATVGSTTITASTGTLSASTTLNV